MTMYTLAFIDISGAELFVIMVAAFFVFGPKRLPDIARKLGRTINAIKNASGEITKEFHEETRNITNELKAAREAVKFDLSTNSKQPAEEKQSTDVTSSPEPVHYNNIVTSRKPIQTNDVNSDVGNNGSEITLSEKET